MKPFKITAWAPDGRRTITFPGPLGPVTGDLLVPRCFWSEEATAELRRLTRLKMPNREIAKALRRSAEAVANKKYREGL